MKLDEIVAWYQKKIGTYDKQQWEKTVEQKILDGFSSVTLKNAKLKTELIDVDLVRGSTFPKAKPKQTLLTVIRLAILRYLFLPIYAQWWVRQTSPNIFGMLLFLYITQMVNWAVYTFNMHRLDLLSNSSLSSSSNSINTTHINNTHQVFKINEEEHIISLTELLIPMALSLLLSLIHSQIVATNSASSGIKSKFRRFSGTGLNGNKAARETTRVRRRKKLVKLRSQETSDASLVNLSNTTTTPRKINSAVMQFNVGIDNLAKTISNVPLETDVIITPNALIKNGDCEKISDIENSKQKTFSTNAISSSSQPSCSVHKLASMYESSIVTTSTLKLDLRKNNKTNFNSANNTSTDCSDERSRQVISNLNKKRNVNWHSPIHNYAIETQEKQQQTSPQTTASSEGSSPNGGGSSSTSSSTGGSINKNFHSKTVRIDDCVQEFYNDLITKALVVSTTATKNTLDTGNAPTLTVSNGRPGNVFNGKRNIGEDDGFESLNGKSSSGEEYNSPFSSNISIGIVGGPSNNIVAKQQLRYRMNAGVPATTEAEISKPSIAATGYRHMLSRSSESDIEGMRSPSVDQSKTFNQAKKIQQQQRSNKSDSTEETDEEGGVDVETIPSPASIGSSSNYTECTTSATEWLGVTTNSEECSYSSELDNSDDFKKHSTAISDDDYDGYELDFTPATILNPHGTTADRISCTIWDQREAKKAQMSVLEISSCIIERVESMPETNDYIYIGIFFSFMLSLVPSFCRLCEVTIDSDNLSEINYFDLPMLLWKKASFSFLTIFRFAFGHTQWERTVFIIGFIQRLCLTLILFLIFAVAERTFKQRFLYGKLFSHLTSSRRARKSNLPHFRLNKVRNIKTWLSVRSYLKKRGPQRSVDVIVSAAFIVTLLLLAFLSVEWLKDSVHLHSHLNLEALMWSTTIGIFLLRFMTLGNKINDKYRSVSVLITEQINLYLQIEQKPKKKDELMVSNSVLKLAADLLKELESPFKISGLSANPYLFTTIKVVILSALSGVLSEMLGFKLKLHKIKIK